MGVTIHYKAMQAGRENVKNMLDRTQKLAEKYQKQAKQAEIQFDIYRPSDTQLYMNIGQCETLDFDFKTAKELENDDWRYKYLAEAFCEGRSKLDEGYMIEKYPQNTLYYSSNSCKTQFIKSLVEHKWVAELVRSVCAYCRKCDVYDEGDYYHTGLIEDASEAIASNGAMIDGLMGLLAGKGFDVKKSGNTNIKNMKK